MTDVVVHRCELRIRRTSGWAWGATPDELIKAATRAIPQLLAARLPQLAVADGETVTIDRPIAVKILATARQLAALGDGSTGSAETAELRRRIEVEVAEAVALAIASRGVATVAPQTAAEVEAPHVNSVSTQDLDLASDEAPRRALRTWWRSGALDGVLARLESTALERLHQLLFESEIRVEAPAALIAIAEQIASGIEASPTTLLGRMSQRVSLAAGVLELAPRATVAELRAAIDRVAPVGDDTAGTSETLAPDHAEPSMAHTPRPSVGTTNNVTELEIRSALPFLLLSSLHHAGWLDTAATLLTAHRREADAFALASGIAAAVLDPLERGWLRSRADRLAIAVFAGRTAPIADEELAASAMRLSPLLASLDAGLRSVISRARRAVPLVLWREERGFVLVDTDGMVVLAASPVLRDVLAVAPSHPIIVPSRFACTATFDQIDYANARFITDAPPNRGETWRSFAGTTRRLFTNDTTTPAGKLVALTANLDNALTLVEELVEALAERPAIPRGPLTAYEATCMLAATSALADLGGRLFPTETTTPALALARFRDLDARVRFEADRIRIRIPLGRRHADLMHHAVLGEFRVPWLDERTIDLGGG